VIVVAALGWIFTAVLNHDNRLTRVEVRTEVLERVIPQTADSLRGISDRQQTILQLLAELRPELARLKVDLATVTEHFDRPEKPK
jgi:archaellum component FlaC